jgi:hypothetical protein
MKEGFMQNYFTNELVMIRILSAALTVAILTAPVSSGAEAPGGSKQQYSLITLSVGHEGNGDLHFLTVPSLQTVEQCESEKSKLIKELSKPTIGFRDLTHVTGTCRELSDEALENFIRPIEQYQKNKFVQDDNNILTLAFKISHREDLLVQTRFGLWSKNACFEHGRELVSKLKGIRISETNIVEDVWFNCAYLEKAEAEQIIKVVNNDIKYRRPGIFEYFEKFYVDIDINFLECAYQIQIAYNTEKKSDDISAKECEKKLHLKLLTGVSDLKRFTKDSVISGELDSWAYGINRFWDLILEMKAYRGATSKIGDAIYKLNKLTSTTIADHQAFESLSREVSREDFARKAMELKEGPDGSPLISVNPDLEPVK